MRTYYSRPIDVQRAYVLARVTKPGLRKRLLGLKTMPSRRRRTPWRLEELPRPRLRKCRTAQTGEATPNANLAVSTLESPKANVGLGECTRAPATSKLTVCNASTLNCECLLRPIGARQSNVLGTKGPRTRWNLKFNSMTNLPLKWRATTKS